MRLVTTELRAIINHVVGRYSLFEDCSAEQKQEINRIIALRKTGMPLAKIIGYKEFWKNHFFTTQDTLDPRPDSETMIEAVLNCIKEETFSILDLGTGTGCLLLSLLQEYPKAKGVGVDISSKALAVAQSNIDQLGIKAQLVESNWCEALTGGSFDIIISNPPYIEKHESINLDATFDPPVALYGDLNTYETILKSIDTYLQKKPEYIFFEVGYDQADQVANLLEHFGYASVRFHLDLAGIKRVVSAKSITPNKIIGRE